MPSHPREWIFILALAAALWGLHQARRAFLLFSILALPGTLAHELLHFLAGLALMARPEGFSLLPRREGRGYVMGSVAFGNIRWYNAFFVGLAPLALLPIAYALVLWRLQAQPVLGWPEALAIFVIANFIYASVPSWQDLRVAARSPIGWVLLAGLLAWGWMKVHRGAEVPPPSQPAQARR